MALLDLLARRWAVRVLWELDAGPAPTFRSLQDRCGGISSSTLTTRLGELGAAGVVTRDARGYALTEEGEQLIVSLSALNEWAHRWSERMGEQPGQG